MDLTDVLIDMCRALRAEHDFKIGGEQVRDAALAFEIAGIRNPAHLRAALRTVLCSSPQEIEIFDRIFAAYFGLDPVTKNVRTRSRGDRAGEENGAARSRHPFEGESDTPTAVELMRARYSPMPSEGMSPEISEAGLDEVLKRVARFVADVHLGRSRRWRPQARGRRFDLRRTLRTSLRTGGDPVELRVLGHPLRNPQFVALVDGSRSMLEFERPILQFAYALVHRSRRARVLVFSTALSEITHDLRPLVRRGKLLRSLGEAWGGGTRIGESLREFVNRFGAALSRETIVFVFSDGLDVGDTSLLEHMLREIRRRSAAVIWINPHKDEPEFEPSAAGMRAAMPSVTTLAGMSALTHLENLWRRTEARIGA